VGRRRVLRGLFGGAAAALAATVATDKVEASGGCTWRWEYRVRPSNCNRNWSIKRKVLVKKCGYNEYIIKEKAPVACYNPGGREMWNRNQCC
jgi:hypothetical protein